MILLSHLGPLESLIILSVHHSHPYFVNVVAPLATVIYMQTPIVDQNDGIGRLKIKKQENSPSVDIKPVFLDFLFFHCMLSILQILCLLTYVETDTQ